MKKPLIIWGAGGHACVVADIIKQEGKYNIVGFIDDVNKARWGSQFCGSAILGGKEQLENLTENGIKNIILGFGDNNARLRLSELARSRGFCLALAIHPKAILASDINIGNGTVVCAGAVVNPASKIGENVIINTSAGIDHECVIEDGAHIGPGVHLGGRVHVGRGTWVGIGATVVDRVCLGEGSIIGAGAVVLHDIPPGVVAYGVPAKVVREVQDGL